MRVVSVVGARPQFIKMAPLARAFERHNRLGPEPIESLIVHTGQHYDPEMSDIFFEELEIPRATFNLAVGSGRHGRQTGQMLEKVEQVLLQTRPDVVVIYGDTNSSVAGALAAAKLHVPVAHVEAGVRSFNRRMPEEVNRVVADHVSDLLLAPTRTAMENLEREGLSPWAVLTGDIMYDAVLAHRRVAERRSSVLAMLGLAPGTYALATVHRAENTDDAGRLESILTALGDIAENVLPVVLPMHPRTAHAVRAALPEWSAGPSLRVMPPVGYLDMLALVRNARMTLTDSGGLQKEAFFLGCPCVTLREETEWVETVQGAGNIVAGVEPTAIREAVLAWEHRLAGHVVDFAAAAGGSFGGGHAADRIVEALLLTARSPVKPASAGCTTATLETTGGA
ncbi:MAG: non-hydrolyzing UDP-N-acetylglucosamine 2-epimerase [Gaiellales bacterium]